MSLTNTVDRVPTKLKKGDLVVVITGRFKSKEGKILSIDRLKGRAIVENVNIAKRHLRASMSNEIGGIVDKAQPMRLCDLMLKDPTHGNPTRIGYKVENGRKVRFAKKSGTILD